MKRDWYWKAFKASKEAGMTMTQMVQLIRSAKEIKMNKRMESKEGKTYEGEPIPIFGGLRFSVPVISKRTGKIIHHIYRKNI